MIAAGPRLQAARLLVDRFAGEGAAAPGSKRDPGAPDPEVSPAGWPVSRQSLAAELRARLDGESEPNQRTTSYCGPAAFLYCLLEDRPDIYVAYAVGLWQRGSYRFSSEGQAMAISAHPGARKAMAELPAARKARPADTVSDLDWMTMSALSTSTRPVSGWLGSPEPSDRGASISYPWVVRRWFRSIGAPARVDTMGLGALPISLATFLNLMDSWASCWIVLQIDMSLLNGGDVSFFTGRHWVVVDPHRAPMVRSADNKVMPLAAAAREIWNVPSETIERGNVLDGPLMKNWVTNLRLVTWGHENHAMSQQTLGHLVNRVYGGYAFPRFG